MKNTSPALLIVLISFGFVIGLALIARGSLTGGVTLSDLPVTNGTVLSALAAVISIGVLLVAGLQQKLH